MKKYISLACLLLACLLILTACSGGGLKSTLKTAYNAAKPTGFNQVRHFHYRGIENVSAAPAVFGIPESSMPAEGHIVYYTGRDNDILVLMGMDDNVISILDVVQVNETANMELERIKRDTQKATTDFGNGLISKNSLEQQIEKAIIETQGLKMMTDRAAAAIGFMITSINFNDTRSDQDVINSWHTLTDDMVNSLY